MSKLNYLQTSCNKYGDFKVAIATKQPDGHVIWTKHHSVLECWHSEKGLWFLSKANNRTSFPCEIILDLDKDISEKKLDFICNTLENYWFRYKAYFSGSKGYHVHVLIPELATYPKWKREKIKEFLISKVDCDLMKKSESSMIALENCPHWKTGKIKTLLRSSTWIQA